MYDRIKNGKIKSLIVDNDLCPSRMYFKSMKSGAFGRKCTNKKIKLEKNMDTWCAKHWENNKKITRGIIFRQAIVFHSTFFCGGLLNPNMFMASKNWFYVGFKKQNKLSRRVVYFMGQKLPTNWKVKHACIIRRTANAHMPRQRGDGTFQPCVTDDKMGNTD